MDSFIGLIAAIGFLIVGWQWKSYIFPSRPFHSERLILASFSLLALGCAAILVLVLRRWSALGVRSDFREVAFYLIVSLGWVALTQGGFAFLGVSLRDDVGERANPAAAFATAGLSVGATFCVAGSNIGNGPGFEVVLFCMALSTCALLLLWVAFHKLTGAADAITIERDTGAGIRTGGWLAANGLILGVSVAGDWTSVSSTLYDFVRFGWPTLVLLALLWLLEVTANQRPLSNRLSPTLSGAVAVLLIAAGAAYAKWVGLR